MASSHDVESIDTDIVGGDRETGVAGPVDTCYVIDMDAVKSTDSILKSRDEPGFMSNHIGASVADIEASEDTRDWERASYAIFDAMEEQFDANMLEEPPMSRSVDLDAVDRFFASDGDRSLSFEYGDVCVTVVRKGGNQRIVIE